MTEQEAIEKLKSDNCVKCGYSDNATRCDYGTCGIAIATRMAIKALEEVQQYRAIGTPEECMAAVEKQRAKKPLLRLCGDCQKGCINCDRDKDKCPTCNGSLYIECGKSYKYCPSCGQRLDWSE